MVTEIEVPESPYLTPLHFCLWAWMNSEVHGREGNARDELLASSLVADALTKYYEDQ